MIFKVLIFLLSINYLSKIYQNLSKLLENKIKIINIIIDINNYQYK